MDTCCPSLMSELDCWPLQIKFVWDVKLKLPFILALCVSHWSFQVCVVDNSTACPRTQVGIILTLIRKRPPSFLQFGPFLIRSSSDLSSMPTSKASSKRNVQFMHILLIIKEFSRVANLTTVSVSTLSGRWRCELLPLNSHDNSDTMVSVAWRSRYASRCWQDEHTCGVEFEHCLRLFVLQGHFYSVCASSLVHAFSFG